MGKMVIILGLLIALGLTVGFWAFNCTHHALGNLFTESLDTQLLAAGRLAGLLLAFAVMVQLLLISRAKWIERCYGLDRLTRVHRVNAIIIVILLLLHPPLLTLAYSLRDDTGLFAQYLDFLENYDDVFAALVGVVIMLTVITLSLEPIRRRMRYEIWRATHLFTYLAVLLMVGHQFNIGYDLTQNIWFSWYWEIAYLFVAVNVIWSRVLLPWYLYSRHRFRVTEIKTETSDVTSVYIGGRNLQKLKATSGQFVIVRFLVKGFWQEAHPFSLSMPPAEDRWRLTIKQLGDFTKRIPELKPGTPVVIDGPHGVVTSARCHAEKALMIAGGIGITPIRAMLESLLRVGKKVVLLYANRNTIGIVFRSELEALSAQFPNFKVVHVISDDPQGAGEKGYIDTQLIARLVPDSAEHELFLCGPQKMMAGILGKASEIGIPKSQQHFELFEL